MNKDKKHNICKFCNKLIAKNKQIKLTDNKPYHQYCGLNDLYGVDGSEQEGQALEKTRNEINNDKGKPND